MASVELQVFPDVVLNPANVKAGSNKSLGDYITITREGLKGIFHDPQAQALVTVPENGSPFDLIGKAGSARGEMKDIPVGSQWSVRPGTRTAEDGTTVPRYVMQSGDRTWWVLIPAEENLDEIERVTASQGKEAPF